MTEQNDKHADHLTSFLDVDSQFKDLESKLN